MKNINDAAIFDDNATAENNDRDLTPAGVRTIKPAIARSQSMYMSGCDDRLYEYLHRLNPEKARRFASLINLLSCEDIDDELRAEHMSELDDLLRYTRTSLRVDYLTFQEQRLADAQTAALKEKESWWQDYGSKKLESIADEVLVESIICEWQYI